MLINVRILTASLLHYALSLAAPIPTLVPHRKQTRWLMELCERDGSLGDAILWVCFGFVDNETLCLVRILCTRYGFLKDPASR